MQLGVCNHWKSQWKWKGWKGGNRALLARSQGNQLNPMELWTPHEVQLQGLNVQASSGAPGAAAGTGYDDHKPRTPPPDLPSLLLDSRIVYLGMPVSVCGQCLDYSFLFNLFFFK